MDAALTTTNCLFEELNWTKSEIHSVQCSSVAHPYATVPGSQSKG